MLYRPRSRSRLTYFCNDGSPTTGETPLIVACEAASGGDTEEEDNLRYPPYDYMIASFPSPNISHSISCHSLPNINCNEY
jgi:hypothetical protein